ncbi:MAG: glycosyltransferase [Acidobacteriota bacterium]
MRWLVVGSSWPAETFLQRLFEALAERGEEIWIATDRPVERPLHRLRLPSRRWPERWRPYAHLPFAVLAAVADPARARRLIAAGGWRDVALLRRRFDLVYFPWNAGAVAHLALMQAGPPSIVSCRGSQISVAPHDPARADLVAGLPASFAAASAVHAVSDAIVVDARDFGLDPAKVQVIRPAVDPEVFAPADQLVEEPPLRLVSVGSLIWRKNLEDALHAVALAVAEGLDLHFDIVGDGPERQRVLYTIHDLGLVDRVTLHGRQEPAAVRRLLRSSHAFVLSSLSEGIANAVLEAMACGLAVVSTDVGGMAEVLDHEVDGLLVPPFDPRALAAAIGRLADPDLRRRLGRSARRKIEAEARLDDQADAFVALGRSVVTDRPAT